MSSRRLRKIQQEKDLEDARRKATEEDEEVDSADEPVASTKVSAFSAFAALDEQEEDPEDSSDHELEQVSAPIPKAKKPKKKKKKAKKPQGKGIEPGNDSDEIETALRELNMKKPTFEATLSSKTPLDLQWDRICSLMSVQSQHLKVGNEMRNLFGRAATDNHEDAGGRPGRQRQRQQPIDLETALKGTHKPGQGLSEITLRRNPFVQGKDTWPKGTTGGLTMAIVNDQKQHDGTTEFRFVHDTSYQVTQQVFHRLVEMGEPQSLITLLVKNPYHISSLIQVSKIAKDQGDHALSSDLLERALFTFGRAATTLFNTKLSKGWIRLDFARPENREIWLAGYQYIKSLIMKGTYRTALEWAKLLLSFDQENDPYCMRLVIHHLALRAHQFTWLLDMAIDTHINTHDVVLGDMIPSLSSYEYVKYHNTPSIAFAALQLKDGPKARELLSKSMQDLPWLFTRLFSEINLDAPPSIWGIQPRTDAEDLFTDLYIQQTKDLWNTPEATAVLMEIAHTIPKVDVTQLPALSNETMTLSVVRAIYLDNTPGLMAKLPSSLLHRDNNSDADPIPPNRSNYSYDSKPFTVDEDGRDGDEPIGPQHIFARLARLFPLRPDGHHHDRGADDDSEPLDYDDSEGEGAEAFLGRTPVEMPPGLVARMMGMIFGSTNPEEPDSEADEWESINTDTDDGVRDSIDPDDVNELTDEDMPPLVGSEDEVEVLPPLV